MIRLECPTNVTLNPAFGGVSQELYDAVLFLSSRGYLVQDLGNQRSVIDRIDRAHCPFSMVEKFIAQNSDVYGYDLYYELANVDALCPFSPPGDDQETWRTYGVASNGSHAPIEIDGVWYRSNKRGHSGEQIVGTGDSGIELADWSVWITTPEVEPSVTQLLTVEEFQAIQQAANPNPTP